VTFIQYHHVVQTILPDATDQSFGVRILPRASRCGGHLFDTHALDPSVELAAIDTISVPQQIFRCGIPGKRFDDLLGGPLGGWMFCDIEVHKSAPMMCEDYQNEQYLEFHGWDHEEII
jgi:hypothetical protein